MAAGPTKMGKAVTWFDRDTGLRIIRGGLVAAAVLAFVAAYAYKQFRGLRQPAAMEHAQLARSLAAGRGLTSKVVRPVALDLLAEAGEVRWSADGQPDIFNAPAYPALLAAGLRLVSPSFRVSADRLPYPAELGVVLPVGLGLTLLTGLLVFRLGRRLFDSRVGVTAALAYLVSDLVLQDGISGLPVPAASFLTVAAALAAVAGASRRGGGGVAWTALAGLCCAAAFLVDMTLAALLLVAGMTLALAGREAARWRVGLLLVVAGLCVVPWLCRNRQVCGRWLGGEPVLCLRETALFPGDTIDRTREANLDRVSRAAAVRALRDKVAARLPRLHRESFEALYTGPFAALFLVSFLHFFGRREAEALRWSAAAGMVLMLVLAALWGDAKTPLLRALVPLMTIYGAALLYALIERLEIEEPALAAVIAALCVGFQGAPAGFRVLSERAAMPYPPYYPPFIGYVCGFTAPGELLCTDVPWATAWYGDRVSLLLPATLDDFYEINDRDRGISGLYLTTETSSRPYTGVLCKEPYSDWLPLLNRKIPDDFPLTDGVALPPGSVDQIFLTYPGRLTLGTGASE